MCRQAGIHRIRRKATAWCTQRAGGDGTTRSSCFAHLVISRCCAACRRHRQVRASAAAPCSVLATGLRCLQQGHRRAQTRWEGECSRQISNTLALADPNSSPACQAPDQPPCCSRQSSWQAGPNKLQARRSGAQWRGCCLRRPRRQQPAQLAVWGGRKEAREGQTVLAPSAPTTVPVPGQTPSRWRSPGWKAPSRGPWQLIRPLDLPETVSA